MNKLKTEDEILQRIEDVEDDDPFGVMRGDLIEFLSYEKARPFLKEGVTAKEWEEVRRPLTRAAVIEEIKNYMPFAWEKANDCRGLSASRSIDHMKAYLWLLNDGSYEEMEKIEYEHYGKEKLIFVCEHCGLDWEQWDDGVRTNTDY